MKTIRPRPIRAALRRLVDSLVAVETGPAQASGLDILTWRGKNGHRAWLQAGCPPVALEDLTRSSVRRGTEYTQIARQLGGRIVTIEQAAPLDPFRTHGVGEEGVCCG